MPELSDDSGSEPDVSILGNRGRQGEAAQTVHHNSNAENADDDDLGAEDTSIEGEDDFDDGDEDIDHYDPHAEDDDELEGDEQQDDEQPEFGEPLADPAGQGLKEISNLGRFTVSSHKQGNGVEELRSEDLNQYWQYVPSTSVKSHPTDCLGRMDLSLTSLRSTLSSEWAFAICASTSTSRRTSPIPQPASSSSPVRARTT